MPELPEVETVRRGLAAVLLDRMVGAPIVAHPRAVRRQPGGAAEFAALAPGGPVRAVSRRGKYLWWHDGSGQPAVVAHLGMSGQFRTLAAGADPGADPHARVWWPLPDGSWLVFRDQRTFGWVLADPLVGAVPRSVGHIGRDPFDPEYDIAAAARALRRSESGIKRVLLAQRIVSGIGNIYADEALWRSRLHPETPARRLSAARARQLLADAAAVMTEALAAGGTSFDPLYVAVNGESGWFDRRLAVYGRSGEPCERCGSAIVREQFTNRSSHRCPRCQPRPRAVKR